jgi:hypothetical protein
MIYSLHYTIFFCACENKQNKLSYLIDLINFSFYLLQMNMLRFNAHLILKIEEASKTLFRLKACCLEIYYSILPVMMEHANYAIFLNQ